MTSDDPVSDRQLEGLVGEELSWVPHIEADQITVSSSGGAVVLTGEVATLPEKKAAVAAAFQVRGVRAVADEIDVVPAHAPPHDARTTGTTGTTAGRSTRALPAVPGTDETQVHQPTTPRAGTVGWNTSGTRSSRR